MPATVRASAARLPAFDATANDQNFYQGPKTMNLKSLSSVTFCGVPSAAQRGSTTTRRLYWLLAIAIVVSPGCSSEKRVPVFPVTGKVQFQGKSPVGAIVVLNPVGATSNLDVLPTGTVKDDGSFTLTAYEPDDGAPVGNYVATIQWYKVTKEAGGPGPNVLPKTFSSPKTSPVKVNVAGGPVQIPPIAIK